MAIFTSTNETATLSVLNSSAVTVSKLNTSYLIDSSSAAVTVALPATTSLTVGDFFELFVIKYTNAVTINFTGVSQTVGSVSTNYSITKKGIFKFQYVGSGNWEYVYTTIDAMTGSTSSSAGASGLVPAPAAGDQGKALLGSGSYGAMSTAPYVTTNAYASGDVCTLGNIQIKANAVIPASTAFSWGTSGATWSPVLPTDTAATYTWRGIYAVSTAYAAGDLVVTGAASQAKFFWVTTAFTSSASGITTDVSAGGVAANCIVTQPFGLASTHHGVPNAFAGSTATSAGRAGAVPAPAAATNNLFLGADATYKIPLPAYDYTKAYNSGDEVAVGQLNARANGVIAANTTFSWGTSGATWSPVLPTDSSSLFTWKGVYANSTAYAIGDIFSITSAINAVFFRVSTAFTSTTNGYTADLITAGSSFISYVDPFKIGFARVNNINDTVIGATSTAAGRAGIAPVPAATYQRAYLSGSGGWDKIAWTAYTPSFTSFSAIGTAGTSPTLGTQAVNKWYYRVVGNTLHIKGVIRTTAAGSSGSGAYAISIPSGYTIDTAGAALLPTWVSATVNTTNTDKGPDGMPCGTAKLTSSGNTFTASLSVFSGSTTTMLIGGWADLSGAVYKGYWGSSWFAASDPVLHLIVNAEIPIT